MKPRNYRFDMCRREKRVYGGRGTPVSHPRVSTAEVGNSALQPQFGIWRVYTFSCRADSALMVGKLAPTSSHLTRGLVKYVLDRSYCSLPTRGQICYIPASPPIVERLNGAILLLFVVLPQLLNRPPVGVEHFCDPGVVTLAEHPVAAVFEKLINHPSYFCNVQILPLGC